MATENSCNLSIYQLGILPPPHPHPQKDRQVGGEGGGGGGWVQFLRGLKFFTLLQGGTTGFSLTKNYSSLPPGKVSSVDSPHQIFIPPSLNSTFLLKIFFSEFYHDIKNTLIYKVNCNLKLSLNSMKLMCFILS